MKKNKKVVLSLMAILAMLVFVGCANQKGEGVTNGDEKTAQEDSLDGLDENADELDIEASELDDEFNLVDEDDFSEDELSDSEVGLE